MAKWIKKKKIGRVDIADFPHLKLTDVPVKIDTGAYTSSIHCSNIKEVTKNGEQFITFNILDETHSNYHERVFEVGEFFEKVIRNSFGTEEKRYIIKSNIKLYGKKFDLELALTDRSDMKYPILLGRKLLSDIFIVDVSKTDLSYKAKQRREKKKQATDTEEQ